MGPTAAEKYGETVRGYRMTDWSWFIADDWKVTPRLTFNVGLRHEYFGYPSEVNGLIAVYDYPRALATGSVQDGFIFPSNFKPDSIAGAAGLNLRTAGSKSIIPRQIRQPQDASSRMRPLRRSR